MQPLSETAPFKIIVGEEITTSSGEIIGLFLSKKISPKQSLVNTIKQIKQQGGLVYIPHPCDNIRRKKIQLLALEKVIDLVDIIEIANSRTILNTFNLHANQLATKYNKVAAKGSDAHTPYEIGAAIGEIPEFNNQQEFLQNLPKAKYMFRKSPLLVHCATFIKKITNHRP
jgi:predicted metal-dependent phosphoesterase TrpH